MTAGRWAKAPAGEQAGQHGAVGTMRFKFMHPGYNSLGEGCMLQAGEAAVVQEGMLTCNVVAELPSVVQVECLQINVVHSCARHIFHMNVCVFLTGRYFNSALPGRRQHHPTFHTVGFGQHATG